MMQKKWLSHNIQEQNCHFNSQYTLPPFKKKKQNIGKQVVQKQDNRQHREEKQDNLQD